MFIGAFQENGCFDPSPWIQPKPQFVLRGVNQIVLEGGLAAFLGNG